MCNDFCPYYSSKKAVQNAHRTGYCTLEKNDNAVINSQFIDSLLWKQARIIFSLNASWEEVLTDTDEFGIYYTHINGD